MDLIKNLYSNIMSSDGGSNNPANNASAPASAAAATPTPAAEIKHEKDGAKKEKQGQNTDKSGSRNIDITSTTPGDIGGGYPEGAPGEAADNGSKNNTNNKKKRKAPPTLDSEKKTTASREEGSGTKKGDTGKDKDGKSTNNKRKKPRRAIPENKQFLPLGEEPSNDDVVGGRGGRSNHHPGNRPYWIKILEARDIYRKCASDVAKSKIAKSIKDYVCISLGGRFLNLDDETKRWFYLPDNIVLDKIKQALRDKYVPYWAKNMTIHPIKDFSGIDTYANREKLSAGAMAKKKKSNTTNLDFLLAAATGERAGDPKAGGTTISEVRRDPIPSIDDVLKKKIDTLPTFDKGSRLPGFPGTAPGPGLNAMNTMNPMFRGAGIGGPMGLGMNQGMGQFQLPLGAPLGLQGIGYGTRRQSFQTGPPSLGMLGFHSIGGIESLSGVSGLGGPSMSAAIAAAATAGRGDSNISSLASDDAVKDFIANINAATTMAGATAAAAINGTYSTNDVASASGLSRGNTTASSRPGSTTAGNDVDFRSLDRFIQNQHLSSLTGGQSFFPPSTGGTMMTGLAGTSLGGFGNSAQSLDYMRSILGNSLSGGMSSGSGSSINPGATGLFGLNTAAGLAATAPIEGSGGRSNDQNRVDFSAMYATTLAKPSSTTKD